MVVLVCFSGVGFGMIWGFANMFKPKISSPAQAPRESNKCGAACGSSSAASAEGTAVERFGIGQKCGLPKNRSRSLPKWSKSAAPWPFNFDPKFVFLLKLCDSVHLCDCPVQWLGGKPPQHGLVSVSVVAKSEWPTAHRCGMHLKIFGITFFKFLIS